MFTKLCMYLGLFFCMLIICSKSIASDIAFSQNNKVGIGIATVADSDLYDGAALVNGTGGEYGYIVMVMELNDLNFDKWQGVMDKFRKLKIIPIFRIATKIENGSWARPTRQDAIKLAHFLNKLNMPVDQTIVQLFNEPNHAKEWGGAVDPKNYAETVVFFSETLRNLIDNVVILSAATDQQAPQSGNQYNDAGIFIKKVKEAVPNFLDHIDGHAVHCYNHSFSASGFSISGRSSVKCYEWELSQYQSDKPVYITETGWIGDQRLVADNMMRAYEEVWMSDNRVRVVAPFLLTYLTEPFKNFSWRNPDSETEFFEVYHRVRGLSKIKGNPPIKYKTAIFAALPDNIVKNSLYTYQIVLKNEGQGILNTPDGYKLGLINPVPFSVSFSSFYDVTPNRSSVINMRVNTQNIIGQYVASIGLFFKDTLLEKILDWKVNVQNPPSLDLSIKVVPGFSAKTNVTIQLFNRQEQMVFEKKNIKVLDGVATIPELSGVSIGQKYRVVVIAPFYLPSQTYVVIAQKNTISTSFLIPGDANNDGRFSFEDLLLLPSNSSLYKSYIPSVAHGIAQAFQKSFRTVVFGKTR